MNDNKESVQAFVIMPHSAEFDAIYSLLIKEALTAANIVAIRADDIQSQQNVMRDVLTAIRDCQLVIADLTGANANVYYELGIAHALRKPTILITQDVEDVPFDLKSYRLLVYGLQPENVVRARSQLQELVRLFLSNELQLGSPVTDFIGYREDDAKLSAFKEDTRTPSQDERGLFDQLFDLDAGYLTLTSVMNEVGKEIERVSIKVNHHLRLYSEQIKRETLNL